MVQVAKEYYSKSYIASKCSTAACFCYLISILIILIPFFLAFATNNFWVRKSSYFEQPNINFRNEIIFFGLEDADTLVYSTIPAYSQIVENNLISPVLKYMKIDDNKDGLAETHKITLSFNSNSRLLSDVNILVFFDYGLKNLVKLQMQNFIRIYLSSTAGISKAYVHGTVKLLQRSPFLSSNLIIKNYNQTITEILNDNSFNLIDIIKTYESRNTTIKFEYQEYISPGRQNEGTTIEIDVNVPPFEEIKYIPTILESAKFAWVQYFSLLIPVWLVGVYILRFTYQNQIFSTQIRTNFPQKLD